MHLMLLQLHCQIVPSSVERYYNRTFGIQSPYQLQMFYFNKQIYPFESSNVEALKLCNHCALIYMSVCDGLKDLDDV